MGEELFFFKDGRGGDMRVFDNEGKTVDRYTIVVTEFGVD